MNHPARPRVVGRRRRRVGVALLAFAALFAAACVVSTHWWVGYVAKGWLADFGDGTLYTSTEHSKPTYSGLHPLYGWFAGRNTNPPADWAWTWWVWGDHPRTPVKEFAVSVWPLAPLGALAGVTMLAWSRQGARRARVGLCAACSYSRAGLPPSAPCPECGRPAKAALA